MPSFPRFFDMDRLEYCYDGAIPDGARRSIWFNPAIRQASPDYREWQSMICRRRRLLSAASAITDQRLAAWCQVLRAFSSKSSPSAN